MILGGSVGILSLCNAGVQGGSVGLNHPELMCCTMVRTGSTLRNLFAGLVRCVALWFEQVWGGSTIWKS